MWLQVKPSQMLNNSGHYSALKVALLNSDQQAPIQFGTIDLSLTSSAGKDSVGK